MSQVCEGTHLPVLDPENVNHLAARQSIAALSPDILVVCDYGRILSPATLELAPYGGVNLHGSLLPRYRGAAPVNWAIYNGETMTGVSVIHMSPKLDAGPVLATRKTNIDPEETAQTLEQRLAELGVAPVMEALDMLGQWDQQSPLGSVQDASLATQAPRLKKSDGVVDWRRTAQQIKNQVRAFQPWPRAYSYWLRKDAWPLSAQGARPMRVIFDRVSVVENPRHNEFAPGEIAGVALDRLWIAAGQGTVAIERIQPSGKRVMKIDEFLRGYSLKEHDRFGDVEE